MPIAPVLASVLLALQPPISAAMRSAAPIPVRSAAPVQDERETLEELLERLRARRDARQAELEPRVAEVARDLRALQSEPSEHGAEIVRKEIVDLGPEAVPLLVAWVDPGPSAAEAQIFGARVATEALVRVDCSSVERQLLDMLRSGSPTGRVNAARLLARSRAPERVGPALLAAFQSSGGSLQSGILRALLEISGEYRRTAIETVLAGSNAEQTDQALLALAESAADDFAPEVGRLLADPDRSLAHARGILTYYRACPDAAGREEVEHLLDLARRAGLSRPLKIAILDVLPALEPRLSSDLRKRIEPMRESRDDELREAALVALARLGDKRARREYLEPYDEGVDDNPRWAVRWVARAEAQFRVADYGSAIDDYKKALQVGRDDPRPPRNAHVGLARCYARLGKLRDAATWLDEAPITTVELQKLAQDPDFRELAAHERHGKVFRLE